MAISTTQITPWVQVEKSCGVDGFGYVIGLNTPDGTYGFEIKAGLLSMLLIVAPQYATQIGGTPVAGRT